MMVEQYVYKIQWLCGLDSAIKIIEALGARSFDFIAFRDYDYNIVEKRHGFIKYPYGLTDKETKKYVRKMMKRNDIAHCEFVRK